MSKLAGAGHSALDGDAGIALLRIARCLVWQHRHGLGGVLVEIALLPWARRTDG